MKRNRKKNRTKISFAITILVLAGAATLVYAFSFTTPSYSIPADLPPYGGIIGTYAPKDTLQVSLDNFTAIRALNSSAVPNKQLVRLTDPPVTVGLGAVSVRVTVTILNTTLKINDSATVAVVSGGAFANLSAGFARSSLVPVQQGGFLIFNVTDTSNGRTKHEWVALVTADSAVVFSEGKSDALATVGRMLAVRDGTIPSLLTEQEINRMIYSVGGTRHLALAVRNFPVEVLTSTRGLLAVDVVEGRVQLSHVVGFTTPEQAASNLANMKAVYKFAADFSFYQEFIKADELLAFSNLEGAVNLAG